MNQNTPELNTVSWFSLENELPNMLLNRGFHSKDLYNVFTSSEMALQQFEIGRYGLSFADLGDMDHLLFKSPSYKDSGLIVIISKYSNKDLQAIHRVVHQFLQDNKQVVIVKEIHNFEVVNMKTKADLIIQRNARNKVDLEDDIILEKMILEINQAYFGDYISNRVPRESDRIINSLQTLYPEVIVLNRMDYVCDTNQQICFAIDEHLQKYFYDYGHHSLEGVSYFGNRIDEINWLETIINQYK